MTSPWMMLRSQRAESAPRLEPPSHLVLSPAGGGHGGGIIAAAFDAMNGRRIRYAFRKGSELIDPLTPGSEIDIMIDSAELPAAEAAVATQGFRRLMAPGCPRHRFYLAFDRGRWLKIDAKIARRSSRPAAASKRWPASERFFSAVAQRRPLAWRRQGPVVALLGPDGAGKGTIIEMLRGRIPVALTVLYLGERRHPTREAHPDVDAEDRHVGALRECAFVLRRALRFWRILFRGYLVAWSGHIVLCDRHPIEALAIRPRATRAAAALERFVFGRLMPWPDTVAILDAPGEVLFARKGEHDAQLLERHRRRYRDTFVPRGARLISTVNGVEATVNEVSAMVWAALQDRRRW